MTTAAWIFSVSQLPAPAYWVFAADVHRIAGVGWGGHGGRGAEHEAGKQKRGACRKVSTHARLPAVSNWIPSQKVGSLAPISSLGPRLDSLPSSLHCAAALPTRQLRISNTFRAVKHAAV